jgi:hypothetical protein
MSRHPAKKQPPKPKVSGLLGLGLDGRDGHKRIPGQKITGTKIPSPVLDILTKTAKLDSPIPYFP